MYKVAKANNIPIAPTITPIRAILPEVTAPVPCANALGGVLIGKAIPIDADKAATIISPVTPPSPTKLSTEVPKAARMGIKRLAVAVLLIKLAIITVNSEAPPIITYGE